MVSEFNTFGSANEKNWYRFTATERVKIDQCRMHHKLIFYFDQFNLFLSVCAKYFAISLSFKSINIYYFLFDIISNEKIPEFFFLWIWFYFLWKINTTRPATFSWKFIIQRYFHEVNVLYAWKEIDRNSTNRLIWFFFPWIDIGVESKQKKNSNGFLKLGFFFFFAYFKTYTSTK